MRALLLFTALLLLPFPAQADPIGNAKQAVAAQQESSFCGGEGARCVTNLDCCRGSCQRNICRSGFVPPIPCKANGQSCSRSSECCSKMCLGTCQPRIED